MATPSLAAGWFLIVALPICFWVAWSDLARMKIPNAAVLALLAGFAVIGPFVLELPDYGWRWVHFVVLLLLGMGANAVGAMGAGDAKFIAGAAPYVALADLTQMIWILAATAIAGFAIHRLAMRLGVDRLTPNWVSWSAGNRFPMGFPLAVALAFYLYRAWSAG